MKEYLSQREIAYEEVDVTNSMAARKELMQQGIMAVPVIKVADEYVVGFDKDKLDRMI